MSYLEEGLYLVVNLQSAGFGQNDGFALGDLYSIHPAGKLPPRII